MTELSADWVLPVDGPPIEHGRVRVRARRDRRRLARPRRPPLRGRRDLPGHRQRPLAPRVLALRGFGDGQPFGPWIAPARGAEDACSTTRRCWRSHGRASLDSLRSGITTTADYSFSGAAATAAGELGLRAIVYIEVFARRARRRLRSGSLPSAQSSKRAASCGSASRRMRRTPARVDGLPVVPRARDPGRHPPGRVGERERVARARHRPAPGDRAAAGPADRPARRRDARAGARSRPAVRALRRARRHRDRAARRRATSRSRTARARTPCSAAASRRSRPCGPRGSASGSGRTRLPPRRPSTRSRRCGRPSTPPGHARSGPEALLAADALSPRDDRCGPRTANRRPGGYPDARKARRPDGAVAAGSPYHPVEDPAAAVVFGGSPERVLETIVDGKTRYTHTEREEQWREVRNTASAARHRMLAPPQ